MKVRNWALAAPMLLLAACADDAPKAAQAPAEAKSLAPGQYEVTAKVVSLRSTDKTTPATKAKLGDTTTVTGCIGADGIPPPALFVDDARDLCKVNSSYVSSAILNLGLICSRKSNPGFVTSAIAGSFTADAFTAKVTTGTSFSASGDYTLIRELTAKRTGTCPPAAAAKN